MRKILIIVAILLFSASTANAAPGWTSIAIDGGNAIKVALPKKAR